LRVAAGFGWNFAHVLPEHGTTEPARVSRDYGRTLNGTPSRNYVWRSIVLETPWRKTRKWNDRLKAAEFGARRPRDRFVKFF